MEEDTEYLKLPVEDRCVHKVSNSLLLTSHTLVSKSTLFVNLF
jgi:hypothetical protein